MLELALHILDIAENAVRAGAKLVTIRVKEDKEKGLLSIAIEDDGTGMTPAQLKRAMDPFYTTKKVRNVGLGLPLFAEAARRAGGWFKIHSVEGKGTKLTAAFGLGHIDRQPLGDVAGVMTTLIAGTPEVDFVYRHEGTKETFVCDTREIRREIGDVPLNHAEVLKFIRNYIKEGIEQAGTEA